MGTRVRELHVRARVRRLGIRSIVVVKGLLRRTRVSRRRSRCFSSTPALGHIVTLMMIRRVPSLALGPTILSFFARRLTPGEIT